MCGIGGVLGRGALSEPGGVARRFGDALAHRGPDGEGFLAIPAALGELPRTCDRTALGRQGPLAGFFVHRRLSIIDLTTGDQPMSLADGRLWIVYNGEVYNYPDLRRELERLEDVPFRTSSDTEVILRVYRRWGIEGFRRLNGMFAFG